MRRRLVIPALGLCAAALAAPRALARQRLRIGLTAVILADQAAFLARWAEYLSSHIGALVAFAVRDEYQPVLDLVAADEVDAAWICGFPFVRQLPAMDLLAVPLYRGQPTYESYLIRPLGSALTGWGALRNQVLAYSDPLSNSGWLVAQGELAAQGLSSRELRRIFFAHGHRNVAEAVASRLADAGAIDGYVWETMRQQRMAAALQTEVVWKSPSYGFPPLVAPRSSHHALLPTLRHALLGMPSDAAGRALLKALSLDGFVAGDAGLFASIRKLARSVPGTGVGA